MKFSRIILIVTLTLLSTLDTSAQRYNIIPKPKTLIEKQGEFSIDKQTVFIVPADNALFAEIAGNFARQIKTVSGIDINLIDNTTATDKKAICFEYKEGLQNEEYQLNITPDKIIIYSTTPNGLYFGVQTICQLLPAEIYGTKLIKKIKLTAPCCEISDYPRFEYRGLMLDCCRYFMPKETVMKFIDVMAMHKLNRFHWHLTDDQGWRIEIKKYPRLTEVGAWRPETTGYKGTPSDNTPHGGFYTQEDMREVVEYARQRYVTIIPEIELPGHATAAIAAYPELSCIPDSTYTVPVGWGICKDIFCPTANTFQFLEDVFTELFDLFPSEYYHIGGDECPRDRWADSQYCQDLKKVLYFKEDGEIQQLFVQHIAKFLADKGGKKIMGWDEIIDYGAVPTALPISYRGHAPAGRAFAKGLNVVMAPNRWCYIDYYQEDMEKEPKAQALFLPLSKVYNYFPIADTTSLSSYKYVKGVQGCLWSEFVPTPEHAEYMAFPREIAISEVGWCDKHEKNWDDFKLRMLKEFKRLDQKDVNYCKAYFNVTVHFDRKSQYPRQATLSVDVPDAIIRYTLDGSKPSKKSPIYNGETFTVVVGDVIRAQAYLPNGKTVGNSVEKTFE